MGYDANKQLTEFHNDRVFVGESTLEVVRKRRQANRNRLEKGLEADKEPQPTEFVAQGSYAMKTMVQAENEASDIDDGAVFDKDALKGSRGGDRLANDAKEMVRKAIADNGENFKQPPEVRGNCVRVYYNDGFHVDIPVYRTYTENGVVVKQIASSGSWKASSPEDITEWFNEQVISKSPDETNGRQMRRMVRLLKYWSKSRASWNMPSGFVISVLVDEWYPANGWSSRDDQALLGLMRKIKARLLSNERVYRPVEPREEITSDLTLGRVKKMRDELSSAVDELSKLERSDCNELMALKALKTVFSTDYWDKRIKELETDGGGGGGGSKKSAEEPSSVVIKGGGTGMYAQGV